MLHIYNNLIGKKEQFKPINEGEVGIYVCGMTVYDHAHIGHARIFITFDMVVRYLRWLDYVVNYVRNITDIDDKIIKRAKEMQTDINGMVQQYIDAMHDDERALQVLPPSVEPRATEHIPHIINMIQVLVDKGIGYVAKNGDVYYEISKFANYGKLAKQDLDEMRAGARVEVNDVKRDPLDFVLWKRAKPGEPEWDSPWGKGRPGWHIECSAMSTHYLGAHFDIHGGGADLVFPHHQNEIAQSEATYDCKFVNVWMHAGYVQVNQEKMSKSAGNFFTVHDVLKRYHPEVLRYFILAGHYRSPLNYADANLDSARGALERMYIALRDLPDVEEHNDHKYEERFCAAMDDDFNTPEALAVLFDLVREINKHKEAGELKRAGRLGKTLKRLAEVLGILQYHPEEFLHAGDEELIASEEVEKLIAARETARKACDFTEADRIRDELVGKGIQLEDGASGTIWRRA